MLNSAQETSSTARADTQEEICRHIYACKVDGIVGGKSELFPTLTACSTEADIKQAATERIRHMSEIAPHIMTDDVTVNALAFLIVEIAAQSYVKGLKEHNEEVTLHLPHGGD